MGGFEVEMLVFVELFLKYYFGVFEVLTLARDPGWGQCMVSSDLHEWRNDGHTVSS